MTDSSNKEYDVIVIGGGITGAGTARDCSLRGLRVLLLERYDYTNGASGRNHGLMHSGARYAVTDPDSARECIAENRVLRHIARHCIEPTDGFFVTLAEDDPSYQATFVDACQAAGIDAQVIAPADALAMEPTLNPSLTGAVRVPDASVDPFRLTIANVLDARLHGADALTDHEVTEILVSNGRVNGVRALSHLSGETHDYHAPVVINAAGIWGGLIAAKAGVNINMFPAKGTMLVYGQRVNKMVINRCRKPSNADIVVPDGSVSIVGTTSDRVPLDSVDDMRVTDAEVRLLMSEGAKLLPSLAETRVLRAFAGVRPLIASDDDPSGRSISRGIVCLDHESRDGLAGLITITGGKLITYRLMAQMATDLACTKLNNDATCVTATTPLPGSEPAEETGLGQKTFALNAVSMRHGTLSRNIPQSDAADRTIICECEGVSAGEIRYVAQRYGISSLDALRRRTRLGMGQCQGRLCACRAANLLARFTEDAPQAERNLNELLNERWRGMKPVAWGGTLREAQLMSTIYQGLCGLDQVISDREEVSQ